jgi:alkanesulfonate monooxygenase SsuD/methylene tetrahydromethanopterin reductase-like flavin-dependent oxidoreductase (luciferase family)
MTDFGYTMMCEQSPPDQLVTDIQMAESAGFDFSVISDRWPAVGARHEMLSEAVDLIGALFEGDGRVNYRGRHFDVEQAKLWDLPSERVPIGCGPDVEEHVDKIRPFVDAGFTEIALVQIGAEQQAPFMAWAEQALLPALRSR